MEKQSNNKLTWAIVAIVAVLAIGATVYALSMSDNKDTGVNTERTTDAANTPEETEEAASPAADAANDEATTGKTVIVFTDDGFSPKNYTSKVGEPVTVRNDSKLDLEFSSADHPSHREHPELNMDLLGPGESGTFTPPGKGTFAFHDHINAEFTGSIVVK